MPEEGHRGKRRNYRPLPICSESSIPFQIGAYVAASRSGVTKMMKKRG